MRKRIKKTVFCLVLGAGLLGNARPLQAAPQVNQSTVTVSYAVTDSGESAIPPTGSTTIDKGASVKTGDSGHAGIYSLFLQGSAAVIVAATVAKEKREREENGF